MKNLISRLPVLLSLTWLLAVSLTSTTLAILPPKNPPLPNYDKRPGVSDAVLAHRHAGGNQLQAKVPEVKWELNEKIGSPKWVRSENGFLTGSQGTGRAISPSSIAAIP